MVQELLIGLFFLAALGYVGRMVYRSFQAKHQCASGCKCDAVDFAKIEKDLSSRFPVIKKS